MPSTRRRRSLAFTCTLAGIVVGSCGGSLPGPTSTARPPGPTPTARWSGPPRLVIRSTSPAGVIWSVTERGRPQRRSPLQVPYQDTELGPAAADGSILASTDGQLLVLTVDGSSLAVTAAAPAPPGQVLLPACFAGDGRPVFADAETLTLVELSPAGIVPFTDVAFTLGECAPLADGRTLVAVDGGGLVARRLGGPSTPIAGIAGRRLSGGGGLVAMTDPSSEPGEAVVREATVSEDGVLGAEIGRVAGRGTERVVNAQLSPDGGWLAVVLERETDAEPEARLRLYRVASDGLTQVSDLAIEVGAQITVLPSP